MPDATVFIVDDDPSVRDSLGLLLGLRGYRTAIFADAESFLHAYRPDWRGCVLLDIRMPGMDGLELQKRLNAFDCGLTVVVMTGHGDVESAREAFKAQAVDFLEKPLDQARLMAALDYALSKCESTRQAKRPASANSCVGWPIARGEKPRQSCSPIESRVGSRSSSWFSRHLRTASGPGSSNLPMAPSTRLRC